MPAAPVAEVKAPEQPSEPSPPVAPERSAPLAGEAAKPGNEIRQEVLLLSKAQAALSRGRPQEALDALSEHAVRFPRGALTEERAATRARTLCALGRRQEAEAELKRIERLNPASAYLARARESCGLP
jgi:tetratricopeptide (TPR) repeat protein